MKKKAIYRAIGALVLATASLSAQAQLINWDFDKSSFTDAYTQGEAVFGNASSMWNRQDRSNGATNLPLTDDTGAATSVTINYTWFTAGSNTVSGTYSGLGQSYSMADGIATLAGLTPSSAYQLVIFSSSITTVTVNGVTKPITGTSDWSSLVEGTHYALFNTTTDSSGNLEFTTTSDWSALQLQSGGSGGSVPEPATFGLLGLGLAGLAVAKKRKAA